MDWGQAAWDRLHFHAKFVNKYHHSLGVEEQDTLIKSLDSVDRTPLFPSLRRLTFKTSEGDTRLSLFSLLLSPTLRKIKLDFGNQSFVSICKAYTSILLQLTNTPLAKLERLTIIIQSEDRMDVAAPRQSLTYLPIVQITSAHPTIQYLKISGLPWALAGPFLAAAQLPHLIEASFSARRLTPNLTTRLDATVRGFPELRVMKIEGLPGDMTPVILSYLSLNVLETLELTVEDPPAPRVGLFNDLRQFDHLLSVTLCFTSTEYNWNQSWEILAPLLHCSALQVVRISAPGLSSTITNQHILSMAKAWPDLRDLDLSDKTRISANQFLGMCCRPNVTLQGLSCLATYCPSLESLSVHIDARGVHHAIYPLTDIASSVVQLYFHCSWAVAHEEEVAKFISQMWPNARGDPLVRRDGPFGWTKGSEDLRVLGKRWERIWDGVDMLLGRYAGDHAAADVIPGQPTESQ